MRSPVDNRAPTRRYARLSVASTRPQVGRANGSSARVRIQTGLSEWRAGWADACNGPGCGGRDVSSPAVVQALRVQFPDLIDASEHRRIHDDLGWALPLPF